MHIVKIHEAKTHFSRLLNEVLDGEEVIISKGNTPITKIIKIIDVSKARKPGSAKAKVKMLSDFDAPLEDFEEYM